MKRTCNIVFIVIFVTLISFPYLLAHRDRQERASSMENRMLAAYPILWDRENGLNTDYLSEFESWLDDNLRGRTVLMDLNSTMQYYIFNRIVKSDVLRGKDNWLFVREDEDIREYQHMNLLSEAELEEYAANMQKIADYMESQEIAFYYFQCYDKSCIYPEYYPDGINQIGTINKADQIVDTIEKKTSINQIMIKDIMMDHKDEQIYFKYVDLVHWNERGTYYGYRAVMERIREDFPEITVLDENDYQIREVEQTLDIYGFLYPYVELTPLYIIKEPKATEITQTEASRERWNFLKSKNYTHEYINYSCGNDLKIMVIGDSFVRMFLKDDIAESFASTLSIDTFNIAILNDVVEEYQPDIVLMECGESALINTMFVISQTDLS